MKANWLPYLALNVPVRHIFSQLEYLVKSELLNYLVPQFIPEFESPHCIPIRSISLFPLGFFLFSPPFLSLLSSLSCKQQSETALLILVTIHSQHTGWMTCRTFGSFSPTQFPVPLQQNFSLKPFTVPSPLWKAAAQPISHFWCVVLKNDNI